MLHVATLLYVLGLRANVKLVRGSISHLYIGDNSICAIDQVPLFTSVVL